ncbi:MAG TPA: YmdB family metallophosphoesterase [Candidatus Ruania gallistercoris]|uniref:YmdB family metallophosphoesterase n=1 Tax=Candidatus Ruania gallistercoris TaxID=2838746 RepID=A0A9D2J355_9MICO|nr:YmdB family metallophosphoesterase [Candidatus Ruania gallistercoris]
MKILFIGDIVGQPGVDLVVDQVAALRDRYHADAVLANGENMNLSGPYPPTGFGMLPAQIEALLAAGVDVITSGNHAWDGPQCAEALLHPRVLRPLNVPNRWYGCGVISIPVAGQTVTVVNVADESAIPETTSAYAAFTALELPPGPVIVDYHGDLVGRKFGFAFAVDGKASAVLGTHTHEPTVQAHRLPQGTGFVAEVGMTGPLGGVLGSEPGYFAAMARGAAGGDLPPAGLATGPVVLGAVLLDLDESGSAREIRRIGLERDYAMTI